MDLEDREPVEEVLAEVAARDGGLQVAVRRGDDPDVGLQDLRPAEALELALLQDAEELGLDERARLAHLVEEEGAARGLLEPPRARGDGAGEGALLVAEQLRLEELLGEGRAVEGDERPRVRAARRGGRRGR